MKVQDYETKHYDRRSGIYCSAVESFLTERGIKSPQVLKMNAWGGSPGLWAVTVLNADAPKLDGAMADFFASLEARP